MKNDYNMPCPTGISRSLWDRLAEEQRKADAIAASINEVSDKTYAAGYSTGRAKMLREMRELMRDAGPGCILLDTPFGTLSVQTETVADTGASVHVRFQEPDADKPKNLLSAYAGPGGLLETSLTDFDQSTTTIRQKRFAATPGTV